MHNYVDYSTPVLRANIRGTFFHGGCTRTTTLDLWIDCAYMHWIVHSSAYCTAASDT